MIKQNKYSVIQGNDGEERVLVYEALRNEKGQVIAFKDHETSSEGFTDYDANGRVIAEREVIAGEEALRVVFVYNEEGNITTRKVFISDELFEEEFYEYKETGFCEHTVQYGEETQRMEETREGDTVIQVYYEAGEVTEKHVCVHNRQTHTDKTSVFDEAGRMISLKEEQYDAAGNLLRCEEKNAEGNVVLLTVYEYEGNNLVAEQVDDYVNGWHYKTVYQYDDHHNEISVETHTPHGELAACHESEYDAKQRPVREKGYSTGLFDATHRARARGINQYHFVYEYLQLQE